MSERGTTWRECFERARAAVAPNEDALDVEFDPGYGGSKGAPVLIWTMRRVYFPVVYDGAEWMGSAPRNPVSQGQPHVGGQ